MNLTQWRKSRTDHLTLPSGLDVTVRRVSLADILANGDLPAPLLAQISELIEKDGKVDTSNLGDISGAINAVVKSCLVSPPVADEMDDVHISITELPFDDRVAIFEWANGEAKKLESFRAEPAGSVDAAQPGDGVQQQAEQPA